MEVLIEFKRFRRTVIIPSNSNILEKYNKSLQNSIVMKLNCALARSLLERKTSIAFKGGLSNSDAMWM